MALPKYSHTHPDLAKEKAEKIARYQCDTSLGYLYRMVDAKDEDGVYIGLLAFSIKSITPTGVTIPAANSKGFRVVSDHMMSRAYAHRTVQLALESYTARKKYHVQYAERQWNNVRYLYRLAQNKGTSSLISPEETSEEFELAGTPADFELHL